MRFDTIRRDAPFYAALIAILLTFVALVVAVASLVWRI